MKTIFFLVALCFISYLSCDTGNKPEVLERKWLADDDTYIIICKGWPKKGLSGKARIESAKEAALINAQFLAKDLFYKPVDAVKNGIIEKYEIHDDYVSIHYAIKYNGLKKYLKN